MAISPNTGNYCIGKGKLYIAEWVGDTPPTEWTDLGNAPSVEIEHAIEKLPHYASMSSFKLKDKNIILQKDYTVNFALDEMSAYNVQIFLQATRSGGTLHALHGSETEFALKFVAAGPNRTYEFWKMTLTPNGALSLIGEEWMQMSYTGEGLADSDNHVDSPYYDVRWTTTTTTSTTTSSSTTTTTTTTEPV